MYNYWPHQFVSQTLILSISKVQEPNISKNVFIFIKFWTFKYLFYIKASSFTLYFTLICLVKLGSLIIM